MNEKISTQGLGQENKHLMHFLICLKYKKIDRKFSFIFLSLKASKWK